MNLVNYKDVLLDLKSRFKNAQIKASISVNRELLEFYWYLGKKIILIQSQYKWGSKFLENLSLETQNISADEVEIDEIDDLPSYDGTVIYFLNPPLQFNPATAKALSKHFEEPLNLIGSEQFARASKLKNGDKVKFEVNGISFERIFKLNNKLKGVVGINPFFDKSLDIYKIISNYRFAKVKIEKI